jgi:hypothetical protein
MDISVLSVAGETIGEQQSHISRTSILLEPQRMD